MDSLANRYASALLDIAKSEEKIVAYKEAIKTLRDEFSNNEDLLKYLESYFVEQEPKYSLIDEICKPYELAHLAPFLKLLIEKHRLNYFRVIGKEFISLCNEELGILEGYVSSTTKLSQEQIAALEESVSKRQKRRVILLNKIDESLIGGVKIVVHDRVYDGSLKNKLEQLKANCLKGGLSRER